MCMCVSVCARERQKEWQKEKVCIDLTNWQTKDKRTSMAFAFSECTGLKMTKLCVLNMNYTHLQRHERCIVYLKKCIKNIRNGRRKIEKINLNCVMLLITKNLW